MQLSVYGNADKKKLETVAQSVYMLSGDEYKAVPSEVSPGEFVLEVNTMRSIDPIVRVDMDESKVSAKVSLFPGINSTKELTLERIVEFMQERYKIREAFMNKGLITKSLSPLKGGLMVIDIPAIASTPVQNGKNASIQYFFELPSVRPKIMPNGKVDYKELEKYICVSQNDLLIKRTLPTLGVKGVDVTGVDIFPIPGVDKTVEIREGVVVNADETEYRAQYSGHVVMLNNHAVAVLPLLSITGDVDMKVGNIKFNGAVNVAKNVLSGFTVEGEDIVIEGIDEDAKIIATNNVILKTGIKGIGKGLVKAGRDVTLGYAENANIEAEGSVEIKKYCFNSNISAERVFTSSNSAVVSGGLVRAFSEINLASVGSKGTGNMVLCVGISPSLELKANKVKEEIDNLNNSLTKIMDALSKLDLKNAAILANPKVHKLLETANLLKRKLPLLESKHKDLTAKSICPSPKIIVEKTICVGVKIQFYDVAFTLKNDMSKTEFFFLNETREISFRPYEVAK